MADPRTNPLLDPKNDNLISSYINKLPTSEENKDALFNVLVEPDSDKYKAGMMNLYSQGGELKDLTDKLNKVRQGIRSGVGIEEAFKQHLLSEESVVKTKTESGKTAFPPFLEPFRRVGAAVLGTYQKPTAIGEVVYQATSPEYRKSYGGASRSPLEAPGFVDVSQLGLSEATPRGAIRGAIRGAEDLVSSFVSPLNVMTLGGASALKSIPSVYRAATGLFAAGAAKNIPERAKQIQEAVKKGDEESAAEALVGLIGDATMAGMAAAHAYEGPTARPKPSKQTRQQQQAGAAPPPPPIVGQRKYELTPDPSGKVTDPFTGKSIDLKSGEMAFHVEDTTYIVSPTGVPNSYKVSQGLEGANRKYVGRYGSEPDPESLALKLHRTFSPAKQTAPPPTPAATPAATAAAPSPQAAPAPAPAPAPTPPAPAPTAPPSAVPAPAAASKPKKTPAKKAAAAPAPVTAPEATPPQPVVTPLESAYTDTPKGKPQRTVAIKFESEQQKTLYDTIQSARSGDANAVAAKTEAVNKYAQDNNISVEQAQKALDGWATKTFMRAKNQPLEAPEGKRLEIEATPIVPPKAETAKPAPTAPPPVVQPAAAPVAAPEPVKTEPAAEAVTTETVVTPAPAPAPKKKAAKKTAAATAPPPAATPAEVEPSLVAASEEAVAPKPTAAPKAVGMVEAAKVGTEARVIEPPTPRPEGTGGMLEYRVKRDAPLYFESANDVAIATASPNQRSLRKHLNKLGLIFVDGKPIRNNPDMAVQLMRDYKKHLRDLPKNSKAPSVNEFASALWSEKAKTSVASTPGSAMVPEATGVKVDPNVQKTMESIATARREKQSAEAINKNSQSELSNLYKQIEETDRDIAAKTALMEKAKQTDKPTETYLKNLEGQRLETATNLDNVTLNIEEGRIQLAQNQSEITEIAKAVKDAPLEGTVVGPRGESLTRESANKRMRELDEANKILENYISSREANANSLRADLAAIDAKIESGFGPSVGRYADDIALANKKANELRQKRAELESALKGAKAKLQQSDKSLKSLEKSQIGKQALAEEKRLKQAESQQQREIEAAQTRATRPIPQFEPTEKAPMEGTLAEKISKEPVPEAPAKQYVPTLEEVKRTKAKVESAEEWLAEAESKLRARKVMEATKRNFIKKRETEIEIQKQVVADLSKEKPTVGAAEALRRAGKEPASLALEKRKLENMEADLKKRNDELAAYQKKQIADSNTDIKEVTSRLEALRSELDKMTEGISAIVDLPEKAKIEVQINKRRATITDLEAKVQQLRDKFMAGKEKKKTPASKESTPAETISIEELYPQAVEYARDKGIVARKDLRKAFAKYGLADKQINSMYKKLQSEGVLNEKGEAVKPEPTPVVKAEEPKPAPKAEKPKVEAKPKAEAKPKTAAKPKVEEEPKTVKVEAPVKAKGNFSDPKDAAMYAVWEKSPTKFGSAGESIDMLTEAAKRMKKVDSSLKMNEANRYVKQYLEAANKAVSEGKKVPSMEDWYKKMME